MRLRVDIKAPQDEKGAEKLSDENTMEVNLKPEEYMVVVENQAKPLIIPFSTEIDASGISPIDVYLKLRDKKSFLLELTEGEEKIARYSVIGIDPQLVISIGDDVSMEGDRSFCSIAETPTGDNAVDKIRSIMQRFNFVNVRAPRFFGGIVGYFAYDLVYSMFGGIKTKRMSDGAPVAQFMLVKDCIVFDHSDKKVHIFNSPLLMHDSDPEKEYERSKRKIFELREKIIQTSSKPITKDFCKKVIKYSTSTSKEEFERSVRRAKERISAGEVLQVVISKKIECELNVDPFSVYMMLREINPSPYMYFLDFGGLKIIGSSPEMLVRVKNGRVMTAPIAGTRPRGRNKEKDEALAKELLSSQKERAEHIMLVDLARKDLRRVCRYGSVNVEDLMRVEKFSHVQHMVSTVSGVLRDNFDCYDVLKSCFPAGTVSGAPKIRAMQIIEEMEKSRRGIYAGAVGYVGFDKNMDFAIAIRTIVVKGSRACTQAGAGIVADSQPEGEWYETENKSKAMLRAIEMAEMMK